MWLEDIRDSVLAIQEYTSGMSYEGFLQSGLTQDAVLRRLEIIGEAAKHVDEELRRLHDAIPWRRIAGLRDVLSHEYFGVMLPRVWAMVERDIPLLRDQIQAALAQSRSADTVGPRPEESDPPVS